MTGFTWGGKNSAHWGGEFGGTWGTKSEIEIDDPTWIVGPVRADALVGEHPTIIIGEEVEWSFVFHVGGLPNHLGRYNTLLDKIEYAGHAAWGKRDDHTPWFKEQHDSGQSLVIKIEPSGQENVEEDEARGVWGLITDASTDTSQPDTFCRVDLTVFVLARSEAYNSHEQVRVAHAARDILTEA